MKLPPRGSAQDRILEEVHRRDRAERYTLVTLFARILGEGLHVRNDALEAMLGAYRAELSQDNYRPAYRAAQRMKKLKEVTQTAKKRMDDEALLKRVEKMTASDDEVPVKPQRSRRR